MSNSGEREQVESTSSRKTGYQVERLGCQNTDPKLFLSKRTAWTKMEKRLREKRTSDPSQGEAPRPDTITAAMVCLQT